MPATSGDKSLYKLLDDQVKKRDWQSGIDDIDRMCSLYEGTLPKEFEKFFPRKMPKHQIQMIRMAWDDLAISIGRLPELRGEPLNHSDAEASRVSKLEHIGHGYLRNSEPSGKLMLAELAWWLVGAYRGVAIVKPDLEKKIPVFAVRDPRTAFPKAKMSAGNQITELEDIIFQYSLPIDEMDARGLAAASQKDSGPVWGGGPYVNQAQILSPGDSRGRVGTVIEYVDKTQWIIASDGGTVQRVEHDLGVVPAWVFQSFAPNQKHGLSQFGDQVALQVAISRLITQKLAFADKLLHPIYWVKGHEGSIDLGPEKLNKLSLQGEIGRIDPPMMLQVDRDIELLTQFSRILNRNPEVRQGEVASKGQYVSAKTLEQMNEAIDTVIGRNWDIMAVGLQKLMNVAYRMDEAFWPDETKSVSGVMRGSPYRDSYTPSKDIKGRYHINVDYGFGVGGYQGFLQNLQAFDAGMISKRRAVEAMPGVRDVDAEMRQRELEDMDASGKLLFETLAGQGQLDMLLWSKLRKEMATKGVPLAEVIERYQEEIQEQAQAAVEQGGAEAITAAPEPAAEEQPLPGIPPEVLVGV